VKEFMSDKALSTLMQKYFKDRFLILLLSLFGMMVLIPMLEGFVSLTILMDIFLTIVFVSCIFAVSNKNRVILITFLLALPMFISIWIPGIERFPILALTFDFMGILFMAFVVVSILSFLFKERKVSVNIIFASIVAYLLLAVMWVFIYQAIEILHPGSFLLPEHITDEARSVFSYYSFVTITTLGYGDITPITGVARGFSALEAVVGQIYLVVLVARLIGLNIAQTINKEG
jgi:voltage-gated potassium channel